MLAFMIWTKDLTLLFIVFSHTLNTTFLLHSLWSTSKDYCYLFHLANQNKLPNLFLNILEVERIFLTWNVNLKAIQLIKLFLGWCTKVMWFHALSFNNLIGGWIESLSVIYVYWFVITFVIRVKVNIVCS